MHPAGAPGGHARIAGVLRRHAPGLAIALLLAATLVAPRGWLLWSDPPEGVRTQVNPGGTYGIGHDESYYVPGIRSAFEGRLPVTDPYLVNHEDAPPETTALWQEVVGVLGHAMGGNIFYALATLATLAALATFILFYVLALQLTGSKPAAIAVMLITVAYVQVFYQAGGYLPLRHWTVLKPILTVRPQGEFHVWYRFLAPAMTVPLFFATMLALRRAFDDRSDRWSAAAAALVALLVYTYVFFWTAMAAALAIWGLWLLYEREYAGAKRLAAIGAGAAILASPELAILICNAVSVPFEVKTRSGLGHLGIDPGTFVTIGQRVIVGVPFAYVAWPASKWVRLSVILYLVPLGLGATTGIVPQPDHYLYQAWPVFSLPLFISGAAACMARLSGQKLRLASGALAALAVVGGLYFAAFQVRAMRRLDSSYALRSDEAAAFRWMRANLHRDETVVTPSRSTNLLLASLTPAYVYVPYGSSAVGSKAPDDEIIDRYLRAAAAFGYSTDAAISRLDPANGIPIPGTGLPRDEIPAYVERSMIDYLLNELIDRPATVNQHIPGWRAQYEALKPQEGVLGRYRAEYLYCGPLERLWSVDTPAPGTSVRVAFRQDDVTVYRLSDASDSDAAPFRGCP